MSFMSSGLPLAAQMPVWVTGASEALNGLVEQESAQVEKAAGIGKQIFFDRNLSEPKGVSCASCHDPRHAFADPRPVSPGAVVGQVGRRNAPSLMYAALIRPMVQENRANAKGQLEQVWEGGLFHDGRAGDLLQQVRQPLFTAHEMNLPSPAVLAQRLRESAYAAELKTWVGDSGWQNDKDLNEKAYRALVEFLREPLFRPFDARIDDYLAGNESALNEAEKRGLEVFKNDGKCADCHWLEADQWVKPLLSDYGYDNVGAPARGQADLGLAGVTQKDEDLGKFRAPTLRNVALTAPYFHNGSIATLQEVMEFYNKRDVEPQRWGKTDYPATVNHENMGNLKLSDQQVRDLTALMDAFTDRSLMKFRESKAELPEAPAGAPLTREVNLMLPALNQP